jgi:hypothetical protein
MRVEFKLSMPNRGSWNGGWSGSEKNYTRVKTIGVKLAKKLGLDTNKTNSWSYSWSDGWVARITATVLEPGQRAKKSDGFCGYDWMLDSILMYQEIRSSIKKEEPKK